jgi:hypothetical protein
VSTRRSGSYSPADQIILSIVFLTVGLAMIYIMQSDLAASGCLHIKGGGCATAKNDPLNFYFPLGFVYLFTFSVTVGLFTSVFKLLKSRRHKPTLEERI